MTTETPAADIVWRIHTRINDAPIETEYMLDEAATEIDRLRGLNAELQHKLDDDLGLALAVAMYGPGFDPFTNPEVLDFCEKLAATALTSIRGEA